MVKLSGIVVSLFVVFVHQISFAQSSFVKRQGNKFVVNNKPYHFIGANMWYANLLAMQNNKGGDRNRIMKELDFLKKQGVTNIRVLIGSQSGGKKVNNVKPVSPALQTAPGIYNEDILEGMDFLLQQLQKRNMYAVFFFGNNWEWSGGFLQYLNWHQKIDDNTLAKKYSWDEYRDYVSRFYSCEECMEDYWGFVKMVITRVNKLTGKKYINEPGIMAWEIANEPRPMRVSAIEPYKKFLQQTGSIIRNIDKHHLLTAGTEGAMGTENIELFREVHADKYIDYATIHIWPKNWSWYKDSSFTSDFQSVLQKTTDYIRTHEQVMTKLNKPLVVEEFGLPRDELSFSPQSTVEYRDRYYQLVLQQLLNSKTKHTSVAGINFWAFGGFGIPAKNETPFWKEGDDLTGDPPMEEQGLNTVFSSDSTTWKLIRKYALQLRK